MRDSGAKREVEGARLDAAVEASLERLGVEGPL